ncbi:uncharacterized protein [Ciconia boyciana]|uniref:uncharacterized protein isoform X2 n=1 Tax=Ciconia boyciana TaxID=52775 RepID=UPI003B9F9ACB
MIASKYLECFPLQRLRKWHILTGAALQQGTWWAQGTQGTWPSDLDHARNCQGKRSAEVGKVRADLQRAPGRGRSSEPSGSRHCLTPKGLISTTFELFSPSSDLINYGEQQIKYSFKTQILRVGMAQMLQFFIPQIVITIAIAIPSGSGETHTKGHYKIHI